MKKLFIGLLVLAAGAGAYYLLQQKKNQSPIALEKDLLLGKWKIDSLYVPAGDSATAFLLALISPADSSLSKLRVDFQKGGTFLQNLDDPRRNDTSFYQWGKKNELVIKESAKDSTGEIFSVNKLNVDSLILQSKDSTVFVLTKLK